MGAFNAEDDLIGYASAYFPACQTDNLGLDLGLPEPELERVAHLEAGLVHPSWRGRGWQSSLYQELIKAIKKQGGYRYLLSTVAPNNYPALRNSLALQLYICDLRVKYGDKLRYLLLLDWEAPVTIRPDTIIKCPASNIKCQQDLLRQGYYGFDIEYEKDELLLYYALKDLTLKEQDK